MVDSEDRPAFRIGWVSPEDFTDDTDEDEPKARRVRAHGLQEAPVLDSNGFRVEDSGPAPRSSASANAMAGRVSHCAIFKMSKSREK